MSHDPRIGPASDLEGNPYKTWSLDAIESGTSATSVDIYRWHKNNKLVMQVEAVGRGKARSYLTQNAMEFGLLSELTGAGINIDIAHAFATHVWDESAMIDGRTIWFGHYFTFGPEHGQWPRYVIGRIAGNSGAFDIWANDKWPRGDQVYAIGDGPRPTSILQVDLRRLHSRTLSRLYSFEAGDTK